MSSALRPLCHARCPLPDGMVAGMGATTVEGSSSGSLARILEGGCSAHDIESHLDGLSPADRLAQVLAVAGRGVRRLYEATASGPPPSLDELIPQGAEGVLIYEGRNSLPAFSRFQKRFVRMSGLVG